MSTEWDAVCYSAARNPHDLEAVTRYARLLFSGGYNHLDTAQNVARVTGQSIWDNQDTAVFEFRDGVLIITQDGVMAWKGRML